jgi:predicted enzyme related to lactoylglutathione lyase
MSFLGLRTVIYQVGDLQAGKAWYTEVLGQAPYFDEPFYVGFDVGGYELGLDNDGPSGPGGGVAYWGVPDCAAAWERLLALGATAVAPVREVGGGIKLAVVADPFGNPFGIIENPHFTNKSS